MVIVLPIRMNVRHTYCFCKTAILSFDCEGEAIGNGNHGQVDAGIVVEGFGEQAQFDRIDFLILGISDTTAPEDIVENNQATGAEEGQGFFVVIFIIMFVRVDEGEVKGPGLAFANPEVECINGRG